MSDTEKQDVNSQSVEEKLEAAVKSSDTETVEEETEEVAEALKISVSPTSDSKK
jgi:dihydroneopterin aldolase